MTNKTILMAFAAAAAFAASANVTEVKFTVKTSEVATSSRGKVTTNVVSKVINGLVDENGNHTFWSVKGYGRNKVITTYQNTYFGLVNDSEAGRRIGQNAELIWGEDAENPENILVAGAWGTATSKSGQVAGTFDGKPATGTWSARVNARKTYAELLAKAGVQQATNKATGVIDDLAADQKKAEEDLAAAQKEFDDSLAAKQKELELVMDTYKSLTNDLAVLDDPYIYKMMSNFLAEKLASAEELKEESYTIVTNVTAHFDSYKDSLDIANLVQAVVDATNNLVAASNAVAAAGEKVDGLSYTNDILNAIYDRTLGEFFTNKMNAVQTEIDETQRLLDVAKLDFVAYTNELAALIQEKKDSLPGLLAVADTNRNVMADAEAEWLVATNKLAEFDAKTVDDYVDSGDIMTLDAFVANQHMEDADALTQKQMYEEYRANAYGTLKDGFVADEAAKRQAYEAAKSAYKAAVDASPDALKKIEELEAELAKAVETGKSADVAELEAKIAELTAKKDGLAAELEGWKDYPYSDNDKNRYAAELVEAEEALAAAVEARNAAETALSEAEAALASVGGTQAERLSDLEALVGSLRTQEGEPLSVEEIEARVEAFLATYRGYIEDADKTIAAIENVKKEMGL